MLVILNCHAILLHAVKFNLVNLGGRCIVRSKTQTFFHFLSFYKTLPATSVKLKKSIRRPPSFQGRIFSIKMLPCSKSFLAWECWLVQNCPWYWGNANQLKIVPGIKEMLTSLVSSWSFILLMDWVTELNWVYNSKSYKNCIFMLFLK